MINRNRQIIILFGVAFLALLCSIWNTANMNKELYFIAEEYCDGITRQMAQAIKEAIDNKKIELINTADSVSQVYEPGNEKNIREFLDRKAQILDFDAICLFDQELNCILKTEDNGQKLDISGIARLTDMQASFFNQVNMGFLDDQTLFYSAPVYPGDGSKCVLVGVRSKENMQSMIASKAFMGKTLSCIIDSRGEEILSPTDLKSFTYLGNIFQNDSEDQTASDILRMMEDIRYGEDGVLRFVDVDGNWNMLAYNSLGINEWTLLTMAPVNLFSGSISVYTFRALLIVGGVSMIFIIFLITVFRIFADQREYLTRIAFVDSLTGGMNNKAFQLQYKKLAEGRQAFPCAVVLMNVVNFKFFNEKFGHTAGNERLKAIYRIMERHLYSDKGEFLTRSETDHFFLCLKEKDREKIQERIDGIIDDINTSHDEKEPLNRMTFKQGCCLVENSDMEINVIQDCARMAIQNGKQEEWSRCIFYNDELAQKAKREQELEELFEEALANHDFQVYLQPKVNLETRMPEGAEALVRWKHPQRGMIPPSEFVPLFERTGKICRLDFYVFEEVCGLYGRWKEQGRSWYPVSVNLSRYHFYDNNFLDKFYEVYQAYQMPVNAIEFELTESMFFDTDRIDCIKKGIKNMHEMGFQCSMDDFGVGYSSLGLLKEFDVDTLKLDRSFFLDITNERARDIIQSVVELANKLQVRTVAEGIEQTEQIKFLSSIHCDTIQGYFFSRPLPVTEFEDWISQYRMIGT